MIEGTYICFGNQVNENVANWIICLMKITNGFAYMKMTLLCLSIKGTPPKKKLSKAKYTSYLDSFEYGIIVKLVSLFPQSLHPPPHPAPPPLLYVAVSHFSLSFVGSILRTFLDAH